MSQVMSSVGDTDALAAEYVLGTLDSDERALAQSLLGEDQAFVAKVKVWERRLGELHLMVEPIEPESAIWERIKAKIPETQQIPEVKPPEPAVVEPVPPLPTAPMLEAPVPSPDAAGAATLEMATTAKVEAPAVPPPELTPSGPPEVAEPRTLVAPALSPTPAPPPSAPAPVLTPGVTRAPPVVPEEEIRRIGRRLTRWRAFAALLAVVVLAVAALLASWRFVPDRVPPALQPVEVMRLVGVHIGPPPPPPRPKPPPESEFEE
jgi:hypothetical protein